MGDLVRDTVEALSRFGGRELPPVEYELAIEGREGPFPWQVRSVVIDEELSGSYKATIEIECEGPDASAEPLLGAPACLTLRRAGLAERRFPGFVRAVISQGRDSGEVEHCTIELEPAFTCLDEGLDTRRFQDATVPAILRDILREGLGRFAREATFQLSRTEDDGESGRDTRECFPRRPWCVQYAESTHDFARRIMSEEGLSYFFDTSEGHEKLVVVDGNFAFPELAGSLELRAPGGMAIDREALTTFSVRQSRSPGRVTLRAANLTSSSPELEARSRPPEREDHRPVRPAVDAGAEEIYDPGSGATLFRYKRAAYERDDLETQAKLRLEERRSGREVASGAGTVLALRPGLVVEVEAGASLRGKYLITRVRHTGHGPSLHRTGGTSAGGYDNEFEAIPAGVPFRPARQPKPVARALDRAVVTAPHDNPLWTEQHGRVTVRFLWDRDDTGPPDMTSYWVPVATSWAGSGYGVHFLPRTGMEVVIGYVGGDPDQPIVLGCRESARNALPVELPRQAGKSGIFTQSLRDGGRDRAHWSELSFDDEAEREKVTLRAGWDYERRVLHDDHTTVDHDETRTVGNKQIVHVVGEAEHIVDKDASLTVHGARTRTIDGHDSKTVTEGNETVTIAKGTRTIEVKQKDKLTAHADRERIVEGNDDLHVHHKRTVRADGSLTVRQGDTVVEWAEGHMDVTAKSWVRIQHAGARVHIDDAGNVTIETDKELRLLASGASATLGNGKAEIAAETEATIAVGSNTLKIDNAGVTTSANNVTTSATCMHQMTAPIIAQN